MYKKLAVCSLLIAIIALLLPNHVNKVIGTIIGSYLFFNNESNNSEGIIFTKEELKLFNGVDNPELYLSILGNVFDVTRGKKHYGPNQQYNVFVGCDASRSFVTGRFDKEDVSDDVVDFSKDELRSLNHWIKFYKKEYNQVGKLVGKYYFQNGKLTPYGEKVNELIKVAELVKENEKEELKKFPNCNVEWDVNQGSKLWCSNKSGGISRDWVGVPRQYYDVNTKSYRCACIKQDQVDNIGNIKEYEDCEKDSNICFVKT